MTLLNCRCGAKAQEVGFGGIGCSQCPRVIFSYDLPDACSMWDAAMGLDGDIRKLLEAYEGAVYEDVNEGGDEAKDALNIARSALLAGLRPLITAALAPQEQGEGS